MRDPKYTVYNQKVRYISKLNSAISESLPEGINKFIYSQKILQT